MPRVRLLGTALRQRLRGRSLELPATHVGELLEALVARAGDDLATLLYEDPDAGRKAPHRDLRVLVNGRNMSFLAGLDTPLREPDTVTIHFAGARSFPGG